MDQKLASLVVGDKMLETQRTFGDFPKYVVRSVTKVRKARRWTLLTLDDGQQVRQYQDGQLESVKNVSWRRYNAANDDELIARLAAAERVISALKPPKRLLALTSSELVALAERLEAPSDP